MPARIPAGTSVAAGCATRAATRSRSQSTGTSTTAGARRGRGGSVADLPVFDLSHLAGMIADLEGYIERRAAELAVPLAEKARTDAAEATEAAERHAGELQADLARAEDV